MPEPQSWTRGGVLGVGGRKAAATITDSASALIELFTVVCQVLSSYSASKMTTGGLFSPLHRWARHAEDVAGGTRCPIAAKGQNPESFSKDTQMDNRHLKRCPMASAMEEMQTNTAPCKHCCSLPNAH